MAPQPPPYDPRAGAAPAGYPPPPGSYAPPPPQPAGYPTQYQYQYPPQPAGYGAPPPAGYGAPPPPPGYPPQSQLPVRPQAYNNKPPGFDAYDTDALQAAAMAGDFANQMIRKQFVRKVFSLVFLQLCVTVGVACVFMFVQPVKDYVRPGGPGQWVFMVVWIVALVMLIGLMCSSTLRRKHPYNLLALAAFTLVESVLVGVICAYWDVQVVLQAFAITCAAVAGLTLVAVFGKFDMTKKGHLLAMGSSVVFMILLVTLLFGFFYVSKWWYLAVSVIVALMFSVFLVYDIQMVMGGKRYAISPDEYVFASVQIYMDVITIFLSILSIVGIAQSN